MTMTNGKTLLEVRDLAVSYGGINAVKGISFEVGEGEIVALVGSNGAGKSSTLRAISGLMPYHGSIAYQGEELAHVPAHDIVRRGLAQVPEGRRLFGNLTVRENLRLPTWSRSDSAGIASDMARVFRLFPVLESRQQQLAGTLSGGEQQMVALSRALMTRPKLLLLDEPSMGLAPRLVREIFATLAELHREGVTLLLVEQNVNMALQVAHRAYLLETGRITLSGPAAEVAGDPRVLAAYLGSG